MRLPAIMWEVHATMPDGSYNIEAYPSKKLAVASVDDYKVEATLELVRVHRSPFATLRAGTNDKQ